MVEVEGLARDNDLYCGGPCSFVNGGNNSISNTILEEASSDALARDPGDGKLPGVIMDEGGSSNKVGEIIGFPIDLKQFLGVAI